MADTITADGKYIWRQASENDVEYEMYKLCEKLEIREIPKYHETREGLDRLDYISGSVLRHCGNANYNQVASLVSWLKKYQDKLGDALGGKVYVHGALDHDAVLFENDEVKGIVNWQYCVVGEKYEDFADILINWLDIGSSMRKNDAIYSTIMKLLNEYGASEELRNNLPRLMKEELDCRIHNLDKDAWNYEYRYEYYRHAQTFLELYGERIKGGRPI
jgi:aminoglycoside phosphotransferase (APT) family kinase protein